MKTASATTADNNVISVPPPLDVSRLRSRLQALGLNNAAQALESQLSEAVRGNWGPPTLLESLLTLEWEAREELRIRRSLQFANIPKGQTLASFDFAFQPAL